MSEDRGPLRFIADLIELPSARDTLDEIARELSDISQMAAKAQDLFRSADLNQPDAHGIYSKLLERAGFKDYAFATLKSVLAQPDLPALLQSEALALKVRVVTVDDELNKTLIHCYFRLSKGRSKVVPIDERPRTTLKQLSESLQQASLDLSALLHDALAVEKLDPLPITRADIEKARAELRHNRAETAIAAVTLPEDPPSDPDDSVSYVAAKAALYTIGDITDALETIYREMERRLLQGAPLPPAVH